MLDVLVALAVCQPDVLSRHVVLQVDERGTRPAHFPERRDRRHLRIDWQRHRRARRDRIAAELDGERARGRLAVPGRRREPEAAARGAGHAPARVLKLGRERCDRLVPPQARARLGRERGRGRLPARDQQAVGPELALPAVAVDDPNRTDAAAAVRREDDGAAAHLKPLRPGPLCRPRLGADVDDGGRLDTGRGQREYGAVGLVIVDEERRAATDRDAIAPKVRKSGAGEHHARQVVVGERDQPLDRAGREQHALGADDPEPLAEPAEGRRLRGGQRLERGEHAVFVRPDHAGARQAADASEASKSGAHVLPPGVPAPILQRAAAEDLVLLGEDDPQAFGPEPVRGRETRGAGADDQHVRMVVDGLGGRGLRARNRLQPAEAGRAADQRLVQPLPRPAGRHEGLVVEARRQEPGEDAVDREHIEAQRRPAILARGDEALPQYQRGGGRVGLAAGRAQDLDQRRGLLRARRHDAARPVVLEAAPDQPDAVRKQRRGEGVAVLTLEKATVEAKADGPVGVGQEAARDAGGACHPCAPSGGAGSRSSGSPTAWIAWLTVWRETLSSRRQPPTCSHHSRCQPRGLSRR